MKELAIVYKNRENKDIINYLNDTIESIFQDYVHIVPYYMDELKFDKKIFMDAYLIVHENMKYKVSKYIGNFSKVVMLKRSINKDNIIKLLEIPNASDVLIVNDSFDTEIETIYMLREIGINNYNLVPSLGIEKCDKNNFKYAITPNELSLVPQYIDNIINIGYRGVSFSTLFTLMKVLDLDNEVVNRNITKYSSKLIETNTFYHDNYYEGYLKSQLLNMVNENSMLPTIVLNYNWQVVYSNEKAQDLFDTKYGDTFKALCYDYLQKEEYTNFPVKIMDDSFIIDKTTVKILDEVIGYILVFKNEKTLRDIADSIKITISTKGLIAKYNFKDIVYESESMRESVIIARKAAKTDSTIFIRGESGTGKELMAQSIHNSSNRSKGPFVAVNCSAIPESLIESELFGYEKGAFTGAQKNGKIGYFEQADGGTLFLDEIGNISLGFQTALLRAIQERQIRRIGSNKVINVDVRIITATNADLETCVKEGRFRGDLYYRLNVIPIYINPLKDRKEDILPLMRIFMGNYYRYLTEKELKSILQYDWPGNVRELENAAKYYKTLMKLPTYVVSKDESDTKAVPIPRLKNNDFKLIILRIIGEGTQPFHGIGRNTVIKEIEKYNIKLSEGKLRNIINDMNQKGLVDVNKGRSGIRITDKGLTLLQSFDIK